MLVLDSAEDILIFYVFLFRMDCFILGVCWVLFILFFNPHFKGNIVLGKDNYYASSQF